MANYGLETYRADGSLQLSSGNMSFALRYKGVIRLDGADLTPPGSPYATFRPKSLTPAGAPPVIALGASTYDSAVITRNNGNGTFTYDFYGTSGVNLDIPYYIFDMPKYGLGDQFGVESFAADGTLLWFAGQYVMNVVRAIGGYDDSVTLDSGRTYVAVTSSPKAAAVGNRQTLFLGNIQVGNKGASFGATIPITNPDPSIAIPQGVAGQGSGFIIDVTHF